MLVYYFYKNEQLNLCDVEELAEFDRVYRAEMERQKTKKKLRKHFINNTVIDSTAITAPLLGVKGGLPLLLA
jgi:hypothetical protein